MLKLWNKKIWNIPSFLNLVKYYTINKFYEIIPIITNEKEHQKWTVSGHSKKTLTYMVCLFNKFVRYFLEQVRSYTLYSLKKFDFSLGLQKTFSLQMKVLQNNANLRFST